MHEPRAVLLWGRGSVVHAAGETVCAVLLDSSVQAVFNAASVHRDELDGTRVLRVPLY